MASSQVRKGSFSGLSGAEPAVDQKVVVAPAPIAIIYWISAKPQAPDQTLIRFIKHFRRGGGDTAPIHGTFQEGGGDTAPAKRVWGAEGYRSMDN